MAQINVTIRGQIEGLTIDDQFFDMLWPREGNPPTQEVGPRKCLTSMVFMMAIAAAAKSGASLETALDQVRAHTENVE